jgi:hypothetical protein
MKTIKKVPVTVEFVEEMPFDTICENVLYVNKNTCRMRHICLCGCGCFIDIPISTINDNGEIHNGEPKHWHLTMKGDKATLTPSVLTLPCKCHYILTNGVASLL